MGAHTSLIKDANLFLLAFLLLFLFYLGRFYIWRFLLASSPLRPLSTYHVFRSRIASRAVKLALLLSLGLGIFLEIYYQSRCPVSRSYYQTNIMLAHEIIDTLTQLNVAFWPDFATLLNVVRNQELNPWEHDVDFSMLHPGDYKVDEMIEIFRKHPKLNVAYLPERGLVQLWIRGSGGPYGPHADIFLWSAKTPVKANNPWITNNDYTLRTTKRPWDHIFPLEVGHWLGRNVTIPANAHALSRSEYGEDYTTPRLYRLDCIENILHLRFFPTSEP